MDKIYIKIKALFDSNEKEDKVRIEISDNGVMSVKSSEYFRHERAHKLVDNLKRVKIHKAS